MFRTSIVAGCFALATSGAMAATVDFENEAPLNPDPTLIPVGSTYVNGDITFSSTETMQLVGVGGSTSGFVPNDSPADYEGGTPANFGEVFLTGDFVDNTDMTMSFASALTEISFDVADIDGGRQDGPNRDGNQELFIFEFLMNGVLQGSQTVSGDGAPDAQVVNIAFSGLFDQVTITGTTIRGVRDIGWGLDNIVTTTQANPTAAPVPVPLPATALLMLSGLGGIGALRAARKRRN